MFDCEASSHNLYKPFFESASCYQPVPVSHEDYQLSRGCEAEPSGHYYPLCFNMSSTNVCVSSQHTWNWFFFLHLSFFWNEKINTGNMTRWRTVLPEEREEYDCDFSRSILTSTIDCYLLNKNFYRVKRLLKQKT